MADPTRLDPRIAERLLGPQPVGPAPVSRQPALDPVTGKSFEATLRDLQAQLPASELKFSGHAQTRMQSRNISLGAPEMQRIEDAVQKAAGKGARESLILMDQTAFVVSIPNKTVITVVDKDNLKQNVFTNIDSAVIA